MFDDNDIKTNITTNLQSTGKSKDPKSEVDSAWELAKTKALDTYSANQPEYWPTVSELTKRFTGLAGKEEYGKDNTIKVNNASTNMLPTMEAVKKPELSDLGFETGITKLEMAKELIKQLKKLDLEDRDIIHALVNRYRYSQEEAEAVLSGDYTKKDEPENFEEPCIEFEETKKKL